MKFKIDRVTRDAVIVKLYLAQGEKFHVMLASDQHRDSPHKGKNNHLVKLENQHLDKLISYGDNAAAIFGGDTFDLMFGRDDRRRNQAILSRYIDGAMLDTVAQEGEDFYKRVAPWIIGINQGNHESKAELYLASNMTQRLVNRLNNHTDHHIEVGGYKRYYLFQLRTLKGNLKQTVVLDFHHGKGGSSVAMAKRRAMFSNADVVWRGHIHHRFYDMFKKERVSQRGVISHWDQHHITTPGYQGESDYSIEKEYPPSHNGCALLSMSYTTNRKIVEIEEWLG